MAFDRGEGRGDFKARGGNRKGRKKVCSFCVDKVHDIDYKDIPRLRRYLSDRGKIVPRRVQVLVLDISVKLHWQLREQDT